MKSLKNIIKGYAKELGTDILVKDIKTVKSREKFTGSGYNYHAYEKEFFITMKNGTEYILLTRERKQGSAILVPVSIF